MAVNQLVTLNQREDVDAETSSEILDQRDLERNTSNRFKRILSTNRITNGLFEKNYISSEEIPKDTDDTLVVGDLIFDTGHDFFRDSRNLNIESSYFKNYGNNFTDIKDSNLNIDLFITRDVLRNADNTTVNSENLIARRVGPKSENLEISSNRISANNIGRSAENLEIEAKDEIDLKYDKHRTSGPKYGELLNNAENSIAETSQVTLGSTLTESKDSLVISDKLNIDPGKTDIGRGSVGSVIASKKIGKTKENKRQKITRSKTIGKLLEKDAGRNFSEDLTVFTQENSVSGPVTFRGSWDELSEYLKEEVLQGAFTSLELFDISDSIEDVEMLDSELEEIKELYQDVQENFEAFKSLNSEFDLREIEGNNEDRYERFLDFEALERDELVKAVSDPKTGDLISFQHLKENVVYKGDFDSLRNYLLEEVKPEQIESLEVFNLESEISGVDQLSHSLEELNEMHSEIKEDYKDAVKAENNLSFQIGSTNEEIFKTLKENEFGTYRVGDPNAIFSSSSLGAEIYAKSDGEVTETVIKTSDGQSIDLTLNIDLSTFEDCVNYLDQEFELEALSIFDIPEVEDSEELIDSLKELNNKYRDVKTNYDVFKSLTGQEPDISGSNEDIYQRLLNIEEELEIDRDSLQSLNDSEFTDYVIENLNQFESRCIADSLGKISEAYRRDVRGIRVPFRTAIETFWQMKRGYDALLSDDISSGEEFIRVFTGTPPQDFVTDPEFERSFGIAAGGEIHEDIEETQEKSYEKAIELIQEISNYKRKYEIDPEVSSESKEKINNFQKGIEELREGIPEEYNYQEVESKIKRLEAEIESVEKEYVDQLLSKLPVNVKALDSEEPEIDTADLENSLEDIVQHLAPEGSKIYEEARKAKDGLNPGSYNSSGEIRISLFDKTIDPSMPDYEESVCCGFPGGPRGDEMIGYLTDPHTQIFEIENGDDTGYGITFEITNGLNDFLFVDGAESSSHMFNNENIVESTIEALQDYASEQDIDYLLLNSNPRNSAPREFLKSSQELLEDDPETLIAKKRGSPVYDESGSSDYIPIYQGITVDSRAEIEAKSKPL